jgi:hypothetical protein
VQELRLDRVASVERPHSTADVIFVHGLGGDGHETWTATPGAFWPLWLFDDLKTIEVWTLEYPASIFGSANGSLVISDQAKQVLDLLSSNLIGKRPLAFVTHSLGGFSRLNSKIKTLEFEMADSEKFIRHITRMLQEIDKSTVTYEELGGIHFQYCPACFSTTESESDPTHCHLCKTTLDDSERASRSLAVKIDLQMQLRESQQLQEERRIAYTLIADNVVGLLRRDTGDQDAFVDAKSFDFSFGNDTMSVDGKSNFAASSLVILKNSFHLGLLLSSLQDKQFLLPRFMMFDNIEDKGMVPNRSWNFQRLICSASAASKVLHQIIFTTSMLAPELEGSALVVGPAYSQQNRTLSIQ